MESIADHSAYNEAYQKAADWLSETEEQLNVISGNKWDSLEALTQQLDVIKVQMFSSAQLCFTFGFLSSYRMSSLLFQSTTQTNRCF